MMQRVSAIGRMRTFKWMGCRLHSLSRTTLSDCDVYWMGCKKRVTPIGSSFIPVKGSLRMMPSASEKARLILPAYGTYSTVHCVGVIRTLNSLSIATVLRILAGGCSPRIIDLHTSSSIAHANVSSTSSFEFLFPLLHRFDFGSFTHQCAKQTVKCSFSDLPVWLKAGRFTFD
ncbi:hypothetical protein CIRG_01920 [Coccidioides immitis RMSCC 2394]|uniref:Uncharacterized protein n=1 Tax=Coccidioides immitis RMSCC 2394 TaxID=404692 RepID=A0A0J6XZM6_COCIT|nr:hypothetical protein CIRG_01920 [Coccidioides immitis RMSCC 2394]